MFALTRRTLLAWTRWTARIVRAQWRDALAIGAAIVLAGIVLAANGIVRIDWNWSAFEACGTFLAFVGSSALGYIALRAQARERIERRDREADEAAVLALGLHGELELYAGLLEEAERVSAVGVSHNEMLSRLLTALSITSLTFSEQSLSRVHLLGAKIGSIIMIVASSAKRFAPPRELPPIVEWPPEAAQATYGSLIRTVGNVQGKIAEVLPLLEIAAARGVAIVPKARKVVLVDTAN